MILEPKLKNFKDPLQIKEIVKKKIIRAFEWYYFKVILNWWKSPFNASYLE